MREHGRDFIWTISACLLIVVSGCNSGSSSAPKASPNVRTKANVSRRAPAPTEAKPIIDSDLSLREALKGHAAPKQVADQQKIVNVRYYSFDGKVHEGQVVVDKSLARDVSAIFKEIEASRFPIAKVIPISKFGWSDDASVKADNTSGFNYRKVPATHVLSAHARGHAIDLNPWENPYLDPIRGNHQTYDPKVKGTLTRDSSPVKIFQKHGWHWGGLWRRGRDYQHFEKS